MELTLIHSHIRVVHGDDYLYIQTVKKQRLCAQRRAWGL